jgi:hypothetical protein
MAMTLRGKGASFRRTRCHKIGLEPRVGLTGVSSAGDLGHNLSDRLPVQLADLDEPSGDCRDLAQPQQLADEWWAVGGLGTDSGGRIRRAMTRCTKLDIVRISQSRAIETVLPVRSTCRSSDVKGGAMKRSWRQSPRQTETKVVGAEGRHVADAAGGPHVRRLSVERAAA